MKGTKPGVMVTDRDAMTAAPRAPAWLSKDAQAEWRRVAPILTIRRILTDADLGSLENYCLAIGLIRECQRILNAEGILKGSRAHPALTIQNQAVTRARLLAAELGLTPVSRSRPSVRGEVDDNDPSPLD